MCHTWWQCHTWGTLYSLRSAYRQMVCPTQSVSLHDAPARNSRRQWTTAKPKKWQHAFTLVAVLSCCHTESAQVALGQPNHSLQRQYSNTDMTRVAHLRTISVPKTNPPPFQQNTCACARVAPKQQSMYAMRLLLYGITNAGNAQH
jgi:hypothetical protein